MYRSACPASDTSCDPEAQPALPNQPCNLEEQPELLGKTVAILPLKDLNDDYPFPCAAGLYGGDDDPGTQVTTRSELGRG